MYRFLGIPACWSVRKFLGGLPSDEGMHVVDTYLDFLRYHGVRAKGAKFGFASTRGDKEFAKEFLREQGIKDEDKIIGILPIANWSLKSWTMDKWNHLAKILKEDYSIRVIAFGDSDDAYFKRLVIPHASNDIIMTGKTSLGEAIALIRHCDIFIAPDTGLLHLASIMGVTAIGLYGPSPRDYIYPYFHRELIISAKDKLDCMPCYPSLTSSDCLKRAQLYSKCMERISVDQVLEGIKGALRLS